MNDPVEGIWQHSGSALASVFFPFSPGDVAVIAVSSLGDIRLPRKTLKPEVFQVDFREFLKERRALVDESIKRIQK